MVGGILDCFFLLRRRLRSSSGFQCASKEKKFRRKEEEEEESPLREDKKKNEHGPCAQREGLEVGTMAKKKKKFERGGLSWSGGD